MSKPAILLEGLLLFLILPLAVRYAPVRLPPLPILWAAAAYAVLALRLDPKTRRSVWTLSFPAKELLSVLALFALLGSGIVLGVRLFAPSLLFDFVRRRPTHWAALMVLYPVLSVFPQGIVYRLFFLRRFAALTTRSALSPSTKNVLAIVASASAFSFMHLVFRNPLAVILTFFGGLLFAWRFETRRSLALSNVEHALYGCLLFTAGLGAYFYSGSLPQLE